MVKKDELRRSMSTKVVLDPVDRDCVETRWNNSGEKCVIPDLSMSLTAMVLTGNVSSMNGNTGRYSYPDLNGDDSDHLMPDFQRLKDQDFVVRENFVNQYVGDVEDEANKNDDEKQKKVVSGKGKPKGGNKPDDGAEAQGGKEAAGKTVESGGEGVKRA